MWEPGRRWPVLKKGARTLKCHVARNVPNIQISKVADADVCPVTGEADKTEPHIVIKSEDATPASGGQPHATKEPEQPKTEAESNSEPPKTEAESNPEPPKVEAEPNPEPPKSAKDNAPRRTKKISSKKAGGNLTHKPSPEHTLFTHFPKDPQLRNMQVLQDTEGAMSTK